MKRRARMWIAQHSRVIALAFLAVAAACRATEVPPAGEAAPADEDAFVRIVNRNWADVRIYADRGGARSLLGAVTTGRTETFRVPPELVGSGDLRLIADPVGAAVEFASEPFLPSEGRTAEWTIQNLPQNSTLIID